MTRKLHCILQVFNVALAGCAFMPSTGPYASSIVKYGKFSMRVTNVNEQIAKTLLNEEVSVAQARIKTTIKRLDQCAHSRVVLSPGDIVNLSLWTTGGHDESVLGNAPRPRYMGDYTIGPDGYLHIPYVEPILVSGLNLSQAAKTIAKLYGDVALFPKPEVTLQIVHSKKQNVVVMGAVNSAKIINWPNGGLDLSEAIAQAGGFKVFDPSKQGTDLSVNYVVIMRSGQAYDLPIKAALSNHVPLHPGDRVILQHTPVVKALCLGAGWKTPSIVPFDEKPSLSEVLAGAGDLDKNTAQGKAVFIFKKSDQSIFKVDLSQPSGLIAALYFPIDNLDIVYVPPARFVPVQQIVGSIMSVGYPAAIAATAR